MNGLSRDLRPKTITIFDMSTLDLASIMVGAFVGRKLLSWSYFTAYLYFFTEHNNGLETKRFVIVIWYRNRCAFVAKLDFYSFVWNGK